MTKISELTEATAPASSDMIPLVDSGVTKRVARSNLLSSLDWYNIKRFGAVGDGSTDDTAAIAAALAAMPSTGGVLYAPPGKYLTTGGFTFSHPLFIVGCGSAGLDGTGAISEIQCNSTTTTLFTLSGYRGMFKDIALKNVVTPSGGAGVLVDTTDPEAKWDFENVSVYGFYNDVDSSINAQWSVHNLFIIAPVNWGLRIRNRAVGDAGDCAISNCFFNASIYDSAAAIHIDSSGGIKISNTKINMALDGKRFGYGIDMQVGANINTSIFELSNVSIENVRTDGIHIETNGSKPSSWVHHIYRGVQFGMYSAMGYPINIVCDALDDIRYMLISDCIFAPANDRAAINLVKVADVYINNPINLHTSLVAQSDCSNVTALYRSGGALMYLGASGTLTTVAPA